METPFLAAVSAGSVSGIACRHRSGPRSRPNPPGNATSHQSEALGNNIAAVTSDPPHGRVSDEIAHAGRSKARHAEPARRLSMTAVG